MAPVQVEELVPDLERPCLEFTVDGHIIALSRGDGRILASKDFKVSHAGDFPGPRGTGIAILSGTRRDEFAVVTREGSVSTYEVRV